MIRTEDQLLGRGEHVQRECHLILVFLELKPPDKILKIGRSLSLVDFRMVGHVEGDGSHRHEADETVLVGNDRSYLATAGFPSSETRGRSGAALYAL